MLAPIWYEVGTRHLCAGLPVSGGCSQHINPPTNSSAYLVWGSGNVIWACVASLKQLFSTYTYINPQSLHTSSGAYLVWGLGTLSVCGSACFRRLFSTYTYINPQSLHTRVVTPTWYGVWAHCLCVGLLVSDGCFQHIHT